MSGRLWSTQRANFWVTTLPSSPASYKKLLSIYSDSPTSPFQDREFIEIENPFNGAAKRPGSPSPLASPAHSGRAPALLACCARCGCCPQKYQVIQMGGTVERCNVEEE